MSSNRTCIVLGGRGFVGSAVAEAADGRGYRVTVVEKDDYEQHVGMIADVLINADGNSKKYLAARDPALEFDLSVRTTARSLHDFRFGTYVYLSSVDVYPRHEDPSESAEDAAIDEREMSPYGFHKRLAEQLVRFYASSWLILRMGGLLGRGLWKNPVYDMLRRQQLRVHPDSEYQYIGTPDLGRILFELVEMNLNGQVFNVAGRGLVRLRDVAAIVPEYDLTSCSDDLPRERYEINVTKLSGLLAVPDSRTTVRNFVQDVLSGKERIA